MIYSIKRFAYVGHIPGMSKKMREIHNAVLSVPSGQKASTDVRDKAHKTADDAYLMTNQRSNWTRIGGKNERGFLTSYKKSKPPIPPKKNLDETQLDILTGEIYRKGRKPRPPKDPSLVKHRRRYHNNGIQVGQFKMIASQMNTDGEVIHNHIPQGFLFKPTKSGWQPYKNLTTQSTPKPKKN